MDSILGTNRTSDKNELINIFLEVPSTGLFLCSEVSYG